MGYAGGGQAPIISSGQSGPLPVISSEAKRFYLLAHQAFDLRKL